MKVLNPKEQKKIYKMLRKETYVTLCTSSEDIPQATVVLPAFTEDWKFLILADRKRKKVKNMMKNNQVWIVVDKTIFFKIPRAIYIKGRATITPTTQEDFNTFLSYHSWVMRRVIRRLAKEGLEGSVMIEINPEKLITVGIFDSAEETVTCQIPK
jgi:nitroimidazol reductase NimA-like FMN-containing flavoprotein (pyridoxamine 5'-phosphate oxidase superfamily)